MARVFGFCLATLLVDFMHSDLQGISSWIFANALYELIERGAFGEHVGSWSVRFQRGLDQAYHDFQTYCREQGASHSQPRFTLSRLSMTSSQHWPDSKKQSSQHIGDHEVAS